MPDLVRLRREMVEVGLGLRRQGFIVAAEGNLSVRLGGHAFLVTPAGVNKGELRPQDLLEIDRRGRCPGGRPTSEWPLHVAIYTVRPDVDAVCHAHAPWSTAFAAAGRDLDGGLLTETAAVLPHVPVAPRAEPGSEALADSVRTLILGNDAVLLGHHGVVTVGASIGAAFALLETVERLAQVTLLADLAAGRVDVDPAALDRLRRRPDGAS